jgi:hypothetical protein
LGSCSVNRRPSTKLAPAKELQTHTAGFSGNNERRSGMVPVRGDGTLALIDSKQNLIVVGLTHVATTQQMPFGRRLDAIEAIFLPGR